MTKFEQKIIKEKKMFKNPWVFYFNENGEYISYKERFERIKNEEELDYLIFERESVPVIVNIAIIKLSKEDIIKIVNKEISSKTEDLFKYLDKKKKDNDDANHP